MKNYLTIFIVAIFALTGCAEYPTPQSLPQKKTLSSPSSPQASAPTSWQAWAEWIEKRRSTADDQGHGPDVGSDEWAHSVDHQLGISEGGHGPDLKSSEWRSAVERKLGLHLAQ